ncbi:MAG: translational GTPase TypA [Ardenticatenaceae bacterium]|nr:translational GTPase TypA [Ardenticatenaceae bacterium]
MQETRKNLRNVAIIAHVDHGKTTLLDGMLKQAQVFRANEQVQERVMDSNDLERERGITITAKNTAVSLNDPDSGEAVKINIVDTPGHADFGGEVERVLNMVDGVLLLVDAAEGPRPQTRFVLRKALEMGHRAIVVINKIDRRDADPDRVLDETFDLFIELGATDEQADFPVVYAIGLHGRAGFDETLSGDLQPLFHTILREIPAPKVELEAPLQMLVATLYYDTYRGLTAVGRLFGGKIRVGQPVTRIHRDGTTSQERVQYLYVFDGLDRAEVQEATAGDIVAIGGLEGIAIGDTLADPENPIALPTIEVEEPTVRMTFGVNTSPFSGREGKYVTSRRLRDRLFEELRHNVALRVQETENPDTFLVSGRGELHLAILIETMRREGYEFEVSRPEVIIKEDDEGQKVEPYEKVFIETPAESLGAVVEMLGKRRGTMEDMMETPEGMSRVTYLVPTRGLLGFRHHFLTMTKGMGIMNTLFDSYRPQAGVITSRTKDSLVAFEAGTTTTFGLKNSEERGALFVGPGVEVYQGMVIGENLRPGDLDVNVCKKKQLNNMRSAIRDIDVRLTPPRNMSLDEAIEYMSDDELLEVTPKNLRIRKRELDPTKRQRRAKLAKQALQA